MKGIITGYGFAIGSMLFLGVSTFLYKKSVDAMGATNTTFFYYLFSILMATSVWLVFREKQPISMQQIVWPLLVAVFLFLSVWFFNISLTTIEVSAASTIRSLFFIVTVVLAVLFTKEQPGPLGIAGIALAVAAIVLIGLDQRAD